MVAKPGSIFLAGDSQCTISAMECEDKVLGMWFGNQVAEIQDHMADWARQDIAVEPLHYWPGVDNIADLATKGKAAMKDIEARSAWQQGLAALRLQQDQWPANRDFMRKIPDKERSKNYASHATCAVRQPNVCTVVTAIHKLL